MMKLIRFIEMLILTSDLRAVWGLDRPGAVGKYQASFEYQYKHYSTSGIQRPPYPIYELISI